jgi:S1-C subfamily serine protease
MRKNLPYVIVNDFVPESEAARAGIGEFDAIIHIGSQTVYRSAQVWEAIAHLPQETLPIGWISGDPTKIFGDLLPQMDPQTGAIRVAIDYLPEESLGFRAGLRPGDILVQIEDIPVTGSRQAWEALIVAAQRKPQPGPLAVQIERDGEFLTIALDAEQTAQIPITRSWARAIWDFLTSFDSNSPEKAGLASAHRRIVLSSGADGALRPAHRGRRGDLSRRVRHQKPAHRAHSALDRQSLPACPR